MVKQIVDANYIASMVCEKKQKAHTPHVQRERFTIA
jgi:hypothetical protein